MINLEENFLCFKVMTWLLGTFIRQGDTPESPVSSVGQSSLQEGPCWELRSLDPPLASPLAFCFSSKVGQMIDLMIKIKWTRLGKACKSWHKVHDRVCCFCYCYYFSWRPVSFPCPDQQASKWPVPQVWVALASLETLPAPGTNPAACLNSCSPTMNPQCGST